MNAFSLPLNKTKYILFGQDPYPRCESASGYAFIDAKVKTLFSSTGLSKEVNKATSLRNFIKMLLVSHGYLSDDLSQKAIARLDKDRFIDSIDELKNNLLSSGVLLLNTALVFTNKNSSKHHVKMFMPFIGSLLKSLSSYNIELIFFGTMAKDIKKFGVDSFVSHEFVHPYNISFIMDTKAQKLFEKMNLLNKL
ncbi:MAG: Uracil-DNA glycosylase, family 1 [uncultured Campylobacterales bacterium]|uniref:Uracil-DNA glycosylase, family 1 n=1 Tax=uncultured Campylobacterales bacterium TaxID=352960 RepID=A0A6S6SU23_9BACT|nr:MAG: Uracil-DNA glycosylase, family 1 [uncultured Campylobacterales bacterium]